MIPNLISDGEYKEILSLLRPHEENLEKILGNTKIPNYSLYSEGKFIQEKRVVPFKKDLMSIAKISNRILIRGINTGYEALIILVANSTCEITYQDTENPSCVEYLRKSFPKNLNHDMAGTYDFLLILGHKTGECMEECRYRNINFYSSQKYCRDGTIVLSAELQEWPFRNMWYTHVLDGIIEEFSLSFQYDVQHGLGFIRNPVRQYKFVSKHQFFKIAVCTFAYGNDFRQVVHYGQQTILEYCKKHNYDFRNDEDAYDSTCHPRFSKLNLLKKCLDDKKNYDWVVWLDSDLFIMNPETTVEDLVGKLTKDKDITVGLEKELLNGFNTGVMIIKNTTWSRKLLEKICNEYKEYQGDQSALNTMYEKNVLDTQAKINVLPWHDRHNINAFPQDFSTGDFCLHLLASRLLPNLERMMDHYCPIRMAHDTEESYRERMDFLAHIQNGKYIGK